MRLDQTPDSVDPAHLLARRRRIVHQRRHRGRTGQVDGLVEALVGPQADPLAVGVGRREELSRRTDGEGRWRRLEGQPIHALARRDVEDSDRSVKRLRERSFELENLTKNPFQRPARKLVA